MPPRRFVGARQLGEVQDVGERLLARRPQREAGVGARRLEQPRDGVGDRPAVAAAVQRASSASASPIGARLGGKVGRECGTGAGGRGVWR